MILEILIIIACVPLYVINSLCDKKVSALNGNKYGYTYNVIKFFICALCMIPTVISEKGNVFGLGCILSGVLCGIMYALSKTIILKGYEISTVAFMSLCHASGMIVPCVLGHFLWSEKLNVFSVVGILLAIFSIVLLKRGEKEEKKFRLKSVIIGLIVFLTSAGVMIAQKLMGKYFQDQSIGAYNLYSFVVAFLIIGATSFVKKSPLPEKQDKTAIILSGAASALSLSIISFVMTSLASAVPSVILFPLFNGLGIISLTFASAIIFKEKLTSVKIAGLLLGVLGLCLVNV